MHQITFLMIVLNVGAVFRLSLLTTTDKIFERPRTWFNTRYTGMLVTLVNCNWCISIWFGALAAIATWFWWPVWMWGAFVLTLSAATGLLSEYS